MVEISEKMSMDVEDYSFCPIMQNIYNTYIAGRYSEFGLSYFRVNVVFTIDRMVKHTVLLGNTCMCDHSQVRKVIDNALMLYYEEWSMLPRMLRSWNTTFEISKKAEKVEKVEKNLSKSSTLNPCAKAYVPRQLCYSL